MGNTVSGELNVNDDPISLFTEAAQRKIYQDLKAKFEPEQSGEKKDDWLKMPEGVTYFLDSTGDICDEARPGLYDLEWLRGLVFPTQDEAEQEDERRLAAHKLAWAIKTVNERHGWVCDWKDHKQDKNLFVFNHIPDEIGCEGVYRCQKHQSKYHFKPGTHKEIIALCGEECILTFLGVEK